MADVFFLHDKVDEFTNISAYLTQYRGFSTFDPFALHARYVFKLL